jgi:catechol 2,3-dioxygenase-like lactoylglutathione lyase family enzyme
MPPGAPIAFLATAQPDAAQAFFTDIIGLELLEASPFAMVFRDGEIMLRVQVVPEVVAAPYTAHGWQVPDILARIAELRERGVAFLHFDGLPQDADGIWTTPDGSRIAWFKDPCGNTLSLSEFAPGA